MIKLHLRLHGELKEMTFHNLLESRSAAKRGKAIEIRRHVEQPSSLPRL